MSRKRVLIVAHAFPPSGGGGVRRVLKVIKYLSLRDWDITVLAPRRGLQFLYPYDPSLLGQIPSNVRVVETFTPEAFLIKKTPPSGGQPSAESSARARRSALRTLAGKLSRLLAVPDSAISWWPFAVWRGLRLIRQHKIKVILATAPPFSTSLVGAALKALTGTPLVTEFRDGWLADPAHTQAHRDDWWRRERWAIERRQEAWAVRQADRIIAVTPGVTAYFSQRYPNPKKPLEKYVHIPNGYDQNDALPPDGSADAQGAGQDCFKIVYTGSMGDERTPKYFLMAMQRLLADRPELASRLKITFVGQSMKFADGQTLEDYIRDFGLQQVVAYPGFVSRTESLRYQREADLLLLLVGIVPASESHYYGLAAKVFDYVLIEKPILALADDGPTADFVRAAGVGEVVSHQDQAGIVAAVNRAIQGNFYYSPCTDIIKKYDNQILMRELESVLASCVGE